MDTKIITLYNTDPDIKNFITSIIDNNIDPIEILYSSSHFCCKACTCKIITFNSKNKKMESLFTILNSTFNQIHYHDLDLIKIFYNYEIFFTFYDYIDLIAQYSKCIDIRECFVIFEKEIDNITVVVFRENHTKITGKVLDEIVDKVKRRTIKEQIVFSHFFRYYIERGIEKKGYEYKIIMQYCIAKMGINEIARIYELLQKIE